MFATGWKKLGVLFKINVILYAAEFEHSTKKRFIQWEQMYIVTCKIWFFWGGGGVVGVFFNIFFLANTCCLVEVWKTYDLASPEPGNSKY